MVLNNINKNDSILLEVLASVFTVSSNFTDNPRTCRYNTYFISWIINSQLHVHVSSNYSQNNEFQEYKLKIQGHLNSRTFQGKYNFEGVFQEYPKIQGVFKGCCNPSKHPFHEVVTLPLKR